MAQPMIGSLVLLAIFIVTAGVLGRRYGQEHPEDNVAAARMREWLDAHHVHWPHHRH